MRALKITALTLAGLLAAYLLFGWLALPRILQAQAQSYVADRTGHRLSLDRPVFHPFELSLEVPNLRLAEPDGQPLLTFRNLIVDLSAASLTRRAWVFDRIRLDAPAATAVLGTNGRLNWSALLDALREKEPASAPSEPSPPRLQIQRFELAAGSVDFTDRRAGFATRIEPLDLTLTDLSTLPDDTGRYRFEARTAIGARIVWHGDLTLAPLAAAGEISIDDLDLARVAPYVRRALPLAQAQGKLAAATHYRAGYAQGRFDLRLEKIALKLDQLQLAPDRPAAPVLAVDAIELADGRYELGPGRAGFASLRFTGARLDLARPDGTTLPVTLGGLALEGGEADLGARQATLARVALTDGRIEARRDGRGRIDLVEALQAAFQSTPAAAPATGAASDTAAATPAPWRYRVGAATLSGFSAELRDESVAPAAVVALADMAAGAEGLSENLAAPLPVRASLRLRSGGSLEIAGRIVPATAAADLKLKLADLALAPAQPYLAAAARLKLASGRVSAEGRVVHDKRGPEFAGRFALDDLRLNEAEGGEVFLAWKSLATRNLRASAARLSVGDLALDGLDTKLLIEKDKSVNLKRILRKPGDAATTAAKAQASAVAASGPSDPAPPGPAKTADGYPIEVARIALTNGALDFADRSLALPFGARIHHLHGTVQGVSSRPGRAAQVELDGDVDDYGLARAVGQIDPFDPAGLTDLKVVFRNVEMTRLTPYSATFAGRKIDSGKLSLDLEYKIAQRRLAGENQIVMDRLTLGERVEAPEAKNLPLDLAIAILEDTDGRIDLGLPVSGSLDDPEFSYGRIIWKAIVNVIGKIVTAPFRALGALFGGSGESFEHLVFDAGEASLTPPEREKLVRLAAVLTKRPRLALTIHAAHADIDGLALRDRQVRRAVVLAAGRPSAPDADPGPISTADPAIRTALEKLYAERLGADGLAALKEAHRQANPGKPEENTTGTMLSRLSGLQSNQTSSGTEEGASLKGADFHALLYARLRAREPVGEAQLQALAQARASAVAVALRDAGIAPERVIAGVPEKAEAKQARVPARFEAVVAAESATQIQRAAEPPAAAPASTPTAPAR